jgi:hypothetical protein
MADHKGEQVEENLEETGAPKQDSELSDGDVAKVAGGAIDYKEGGNA